MFDDDVCNFYFFRLLWKKLREKERERKRGYMIYREKRGVFSRVSVGQFKRVIIAVSRFLFLGNTPHGLVNLKGFHSTYSGFRYISAFEAAD